MVVPTEDHPDGQPLTMEQVYELWEQSLKPEQQPIFFVRLECSYSGRMLEKLLDSKSHNKNNKHVPQMSSSCGNSKSKHDAKYGGLLIAERYFNCIQDEDITME